VAVLVAERQKLFSTRSPWWCGTLALLLTVGPTALFVGLSPADSVDVAGTQQIGPQFGLVVIMVMAALAVTTEYRFGTIRATFTAVPHRMVALGAKTVVVTLLAGVLGELAAFGSWALSTVLVPSADLALRTAADWRVVAGVGLVWMVAAVLALAVGMLIRHTAGAVAVLLVYQLLGEGLIGLIPKAGVNIQRWLPFQALTDFLFGDQPTAPAQRAAVLRVDFPFSPWGEGVYAAGIALVLLLIALYVADRRDA
jgi:ABC-2 type transport system permease protein